MDNEAIAVKIQQISAAVNDLCSGLSIIAGNNAVDAEKADRGKDVLTKSMMLTSAAQRLALRLRRLAEQQDKRRAAGECVNDGSDIRLVADDLCSIAIELRVHLAELWDCADGRADNAATAQHAVQLQLLAAQQILESVELLEDELRKGHNL